jgi:hypothetical protein
VARKPGGRWAHGKIATLLSVKNVLANSMTYLAEFTISIIYD